MAQGFDVIVIGLGHAGAEAALAASRLGARVAAITQVRARACLMSCNPAIGGPGKSQLVRELDALGGAMAEAADQTALQARLLNRSKGPAGWATRLQVDRMAYARAMQERLASAPALEVVEGEVVGLEVSAGRVRGVALEGGVSLVAGCVILTTGTFLAARMHVGRKTSAGGRAGDRASEGLADSLRSLGIETGRFKTGTPPRLVGGTIDYSRCEEQPSETDVVPLSMRTERVGFPRMTQRSTFVTRTNRDTHEVVRVALEDSPLTTGAITGQGPRYCPSLEQKVLNYPEKPGHLVYLEPDGLESDEVYPAGLSTSLPAVAQLRLLRTIPGLERVEVARPGYAVEYDYLVPGQLSPWFELNGLGGLFCAGQINGSSGYEEAAGQGLVAGVNAARVARGDAPWVPNRDESYLGVLCDDLINRRFDEPYRLLPARTEQRLVLREDNAARRLVPMALDLGLIGSGDAEPVLRLKLEAEKVTNRLTPSQVRWLQAPRRELEIARAPGAPLHGLERELARAIFIDARYAPYQKQRLVALERLRLEADLALPEQLNARGIPGLSSEIRDLLERGRPKRISEAAALPGMTSDGIAILVVHARRLERLRIVSRGTTD